MVPGSALRTPPTRGKPATDGCPVAALLNLVRRTATLAPASVAPSRRVAPGLLDGRNTGTSESEPPGGAKSASGKNQAPDPRANSASPNGRLSSPEYFWTCSVRFPTASAGRAGVVARRSG